MKSLLPMHQPPYILIAEDQQEAFLQHFPEHISRAFADLACLPDQRVLPEHSPHSIIIIECLEDRELYSAYLTAWATSDLKYIIYYITLFTNNEGTPVLVKYFEGLGQYNMYRTLLPMPIREDYREYMQYESLLEAYMNHKASGKS